MRSLCCALFSLIVTTAAAGDLDVRVSDGRVSVRASAAPVCQVLDRMAFQIERGSYGSISLDGLGFIVLGLTPEAMGKGNWSVGLIVDERASAEQKQAITTIASGAAGGPLCLL